MTPEDFLRQDLMQNRLVPAAAGPVLVVLCHSGARPLRIVVMNHSVASGPGDQPIPS
jgi:hypothetical protein